jgi:hypothetical protein
VATITKCDFKSCGVGFDVDGPSAAFLRKTVDGKPILLSFCSENHVVAWITEDQKKDKRQSRQKRVPRA